MENIAIYGAGGFGREVLTLIEQINEQENKYNFIGFFDDGIKRGEIINGFPVLGGINVLNHWDERLALVLAIGSPMMKKSVFSRIRNSNLSYPSLIHPSTQICAAHYVELEDGCIVCAGCIITVNVVLHKFVILNLSCTVGHDTEIGEFSSFMPAVNISGEVVIGKDVYVGTGAKIINQLSIGDGTIVGAGAVVAKTLPPNCTAVGIPAKPIKFHEESENTWGRTVCS